MLMTTLLLASAAASDLSFEKQARAACHAPGTAQPRVAGIRVEPFKAAPGDLPGLRVTHEASGSWMNIYHDAVSGRSARARAAMFFAIITSGHMPEEIIASVAQGNGLRNFPEYLILRALMRQSYRFFNNNTGFVANLFHCESRWERPSNLLIPELLFFLLGQRKVRGDNGQMSFVALSRMLLEMEGLGFVRSDVKEAALFCLKKELIEVDTSSLEELGDKDSVKATASGWAHIRLLSSRLEYVAAVLPTTAIDDKQLSARVYDLMQTEQRFGRMPYNQAITVVQGFESYLNRQSALISAHPGAAQRRLSGSAYIISKVQEAIRFARRENGPGVPQADLLDL
jgi:hypothetical protein